VKITPNTAQKLMVEQLQGEREGKNVAENAEEDESTKGEISCDLVAI
jgi:hypothetical protein